MADWGFAQSLWLWLLPIPFVWLRIRRKQRAAWPALWPAPRIRYPLLHRLAINYSVEPEHKYQPAKDRLAAIAFILFVIALAQPVRFTDRISASANTEPVDLVLLVDTNITMVLKDYVVDDQPIDRMSMTRHLLNDFVTAYSGRRIGLSIMGNPPLHWLPFTSDKKSVLEAISRIQTTLGGRLSDMSASLQLVSDRYRSDDDKVVVMITDSSLQLGAVSPQSAASTLAKKGYTLYVIAIGSTEIGQEQIDKAGFIYEPVDLETLQKVAEAGSGQMFHALDATAFRDALATIESQHRQVITGAQEFRLVQNWYQVPLLSGLLILVYVIFATPRSAALRGQE